MGRPGCLLEAPGAPREARPPKAAQRHSKETVWVVWGCLLEVSGPPLGGLRAPKGTPKSLQGRGQYEASDLKLTQTKTSELKLHNFFPQGHWFSRAEAELAKRKQFKFVFWFLAVLGQFWAQVGPRTPSIGSGSNNGATRTQNQPRGPIIIPFRDSR